ncbi:MAG: STAS domain-containing protein [Acidobacteriota bacterium]
MATIPTRLRLTGADKEALLAYWRFYEPIAAQISSELRESLRELPEWSALMRAMTPAQIADNDRKSLALQRQAIVDNNWAPYLQELSTQGAQYARMGISFLAWYDIIAIYREAIRRRIVANLGDSPVAQIADGMTRFIDIAMGHLGEAYLATKEQIIASQQEAIRKLSLPILQVRDRLLILPIVGAIDAARARQLTETLLAAIRDRRARGVVLDVTGVPDVDTATASYLVQACDAAQLMGATIVITGISAEIAQALVALGARLPAATTLGDLQEGIEVIERVLGFHDGIAARED